MWVARSADGFQAFPDALASNRRLRLGVATVGTHCSIVGQARLSHYSSSNHDVRWWDHALGIAECVVEVLHRTSETGKLPKVVARVVTSGYSDQQRDPKSAPMKNRPCEHTAPRQRRDMPPHTNTHEHNKSKTLKYTGTRGSLESLLSRSRVQSSTAPFKMILLRLGVYSLIIMLTKCMIELSFAKNIDLVSSSFLCPENSARSAMVRGCCRVPALKLISSCGKTKSVTHGCPLSACVVSLSWSPIRFFLSWREIQDHEPSCNVIWTYQTRTSTWNLCHPEFFHVFETSNSVFTKQFPTDSAFQVQIGDMPLVLPSREANSNCLSWPAKMRGKRVHRKQIDRCRSCQFRLTSVPSLLPS